jgi:hypothetical protein
MSASQWAALSADAKLIIANQWLEKRRKAKAEADRATTK